MKRVLILIGLIVALGLPAWEIQKKERLLASGQPVLLELAPRDPRSLMQGDYMRLDYALTRSLPNAASWPRDGAIVVRLDADGVARYVRRDTGEPLQTGEHRLTYRRCDQQVQVGTNAFYFQEGHGPVYQAARYGELRVAPDGTAVLVGLRDLDRQPLRP